VSARRGRHHAGSVRAPARDTSGAPRPHHHHRAVELADPAHRRPRPRPQPAGTPRTGKHASGQIDLGLLDVQHHDHEDCLPARMGALSTTAAAAKGPTRVAG
jgi:hypothetical protein